MITEEYLFKDAERNLKVTGKSYLYISLLCFGFTRKYMPIFLYVTKAIISEREVYGGIRDDIESYIFYIVNYVRFVNFEPSAIVSFIHM